MTWQVGAMLPAPNAGGEELTAQAQLIEHLGFDWICCGEHVLFTVPVANAFITLAHAAAVTSRIELLTSVTVAPLYPAGLLAKLATTLDLPSGGRLHLGIGAGGEFPKEFAACGVPVNERGSRTDEALEVLRACWDQETADFHGRHAIVEGKMRPKPRRRPPIWIGGRKEAAIRRAARFGDYWLPYLVSPRHVARGHAQLQEAVAAAGRAEGDVRTMTFCFMSVDRDAALARATAAEHVSAIYNQDMTSMADSLLVAGSPQECVERLSEYAAAGSGGVVASLVGSQDRWDDRLRLFAEEVLPAARAFTAAA